MTHRCHWLFVGIFNFSATLARKHRHDWWQNFDNFAEETPWLLTATRLNPTSPWIQWSVRLAFWCNTIQVSVHGGSAYSYQEKNKIGWHNNVSSGSSKVDLLRWKEQGKYLMQPLLHETVDGSNLLPSFMKSHCWYLRSPPTPISNHLRITELSLVLIKNFKLNVFPLKLLWNLQSLRDLSSNISE